MSDDPTRRLNGIQPRVEALERCTDELRGDMKSHTRSLTVIETDLKHVKSTVDDLTRHLGGRVMLGAGGGAGVITALAIALLKLLEGR